MKPKGKAVKYTETPTEPAPVLQDLVAPSIHEVGAFEAKTHLSSILEKVANGHTYFITKRGKRVAEIRPIISSPKKRTAGLWKDRIWMSADFDAPLEDFKEYT